MWYDKHNTVYFGNATQKPAKTLDDISDLPKPGAEPEPETEPTEPEVEPDNVQNAEISDVYADGLLNTYDDWFLVPTSRPIIAPPTPKSNLVEIAGSDGGLDLSEYPANRPTFQNREGSIEFYLDRDNCPYRWVEVYSMVMAAIHGKHLHMVLNEDFSYYYDGRFYVEAFDSSESYSKLTIHYNVKPYKYSRCTSIEDWIWDPFNFRTGVILQQVWKDIKAEDASKVGPTANVEHWSIDLDATSKDPNKVPEGIDMNCGYPWLRDVLSYGPVSPIFHVKSTNEQGISVIYQNLELGLTVNQAFLDYDHPTVKDGHVSYPPLLDGTAIIPDILLSCMNPSMQHIRMAFIGEGTVSVEFRLARL